MNAAAKQRLVRAALKARESAVAPYSKFKVGAALLTKRGRIIPGANVESASYGLTCCAERIALFKGLTEGPKDFLAIAVAARFDGGAMPCGACRQLLAEYAPTATVLVVDSAQPKVIQEFSVAELLPGAFRFGATAENQSGQRKVAATASLSRTLQSPRPLGGEG